MDPVPVPQAADPAQVSLMDKQLMLYLTQQSDGLAAAHNEIADHGGAPLAQQAEALQQAMSEADGQLGAAVGLQQRALQAAQQGLDAQLQSQLQGQAAWLSQAQQQIPPQLLQQFMIQEPPLAAQATTGPPTLGGYDSGAQRPPFPSTLTDFGPGTGLSASQAPAVVPAGPALLPAGGINGTAPQPSPPPTAPPSVQGLAPVPTPIPLPAPPTSIPPEWQDVLHYLCQCLHSALIAGRDPVDWDQPLAEFFGEQRSKWHQRAQAWIGDGRGDPDTFPSLGAFMAARPGI